jgi:hypothetical protein
MSSEANEKKYCRCSPSKLINAISMVQSGYISKKIKTVMIFGILTDKLKLSGNAPTGLNPNSVC